MSHYALFAGENGAVLAAEVDDQVEPVDRANDGLDESDMGLLRRSPDSPAPADLPDAAKGMSAALGEVIEQLKALGSDELKIDVGVKLSSQFGVAVAKGASEGHLTVTMTWRRGGMS